MQYLTRSITIESTILVTRADILATIDGKDGLGVAFVGYL